MDGRTVREFKNYALRLSDGFGRGYRFFRKLSPEHDIYWKRINAFRNLRLREQGLFVPDDDERDEEIFDLEHPIELTLGEWETFKKELGDLLLNAKGE